MPEEVERIWEEMRKGETVYQNILDENKKYYEKSKKLDT